MVQNMAGIRKSIITPLVYHEVAGQRMSAGGNVKDNYSGLIKQYGYMGIKALSELHASEWHKLFFADRYRQGLK